MKREAKKRREALNRQRDERDDVSNSNLLQKRHSFCVQGWELWRKIIQSDTNHSVTLVLVFTDCPSEMISFSDKLPLAVTVV